LCVVYNVCTKLYTRDNRYTMTLLGGEVRRRRRGVAYESYAEW